VIYARQRFEAIEFNGGIQDLLTTALQGDSDEPWYTELGWPRNGEHRYLPHHS